MVAARGRGRATGKEFSDGVLRLPLTTENFVATKAGLKPFEGRVNSKYIRVRLFNKDGTRKKIQTICYSLGYQRNCEKLWMKFLRCDQSKEPFSSNSWKFPANSWRIFQEPMYHVSVMQYWGVEANTERDMFTTWWVGFEDGDKTIEPASNFPDKWGEFLDSVKERGCKASPIEPGGAPSGAREPECESSPSLPDTQFRDPVGNCVKLALFLLLNLPRKLRRAIDQQIPDHRCSIKQLAAVVRGFSLEDLSKSNKHDLEWLLKQQSGYFLVMGSFGHTVGVDAFRRLIWDCVEKTALPLTSGALAHCNIDMARKLRQVTGLRRNLRSRA